MDLRALQKNGLSKVAPLFAGWEESMVWSCLQGEMGQAYGAAGLNSAQLVVGDFAFYAGEVDLGLAAHVPAGFPSAHLLLVPRDSAWEAALERAHPQATRFTRYALKKEGDCFDRAHLKALAAGLPTGYSLQPLRGPQYRQALAAGWSKDLCSQFSGEGDFLRRGLGVVAYRGAELVCGASSYTVYHGGLEIEVDTKEGYRRQGLAAACAAQLILECLWRGLTPCWDAANPESLALATKLGYHLDYAYTAYAAPVQE